MQTISELKGTHDVPVVIADHQGVITYVNDRFTAAYGWPAAALTGQPLATIIPTHLRDAHNLGFSRFLLTAQGTLLNEPLRLRILTQDGQELEAEHLIMAAQQDGHWTFGAIIRPLGQ